MTGPSVVYWTNIPAPYMVERFNALSDRQSLAFQVWFSARSESDRSWSVDESTWRFQFRYVPSVVMRGRRLTSPFVLLRSPRPDVLVTLYSRLSFLAGWQLARIYGIKTAFWVLPTYDRWARRRPVHRLIRRRVLPYTLPRTSALLTTGPDGANFLERHGAPSQLVRFLSHPVDVTFFIHEGRAALARRDITRAELGLVGTTYTYVGRLWWGKGLDHLIEAFRTVQSVNPYSSLLLVGDGPEERHLRRTAMAMGLRNVRFIGFRQRSELPAIYAASDVFVFPTLGDPYGHAVDEAMASSLPVISTTEAGEIKSRIAEAVNGFLVPPENSQALADRMLRLQDQRLRKEFGSTSLERIRPYTLARWAAEFEATVRDIAEGVVGR